MAKYMQEQLESLASLLSDDELEALVSKCKNLIEERQRIKREELRQELMKNLQKAIGDVLHNGFNLVIENLDNSSWAVQFLPDESPNIEIE